MNAVAEVYANGWGVPRDVRNAIALVCHGSEVPTELVGIVSALWTAKDARKPAPFLICDHVTSGMTAGWCAAQQRSEKEVRRQREYASLTKRWTFTQRVALDALRTAASEYFSTHASEELRHVRNGEGGDLD